MWIISGAWVHPTPADGVQGLPLVRHTFAFLIGDQDAKLVRAQAELFAYAYDVESLELEAGAMKKGAAAGGAR